MQVKLLNISLILTSLVGAFGIPIGDPKFIIPAIILESIFIALSILSFKKIRHVIIPSIIISIIVIVGNTVSPQHLKIMFTLDPVGNALVLIIGGYILQGIILYSGSKSLYLSRLQKTIL